MNVSKSRRIVIASLAGALTLPAMVLAQEKPAGDAGAKAKCYGVNKCKASGDCGGPGHSCAGQNACKRQGYIEMDKDTCLRLDGGRLTANEEKPAPDAKSKEKKG
ncbi:MAG TPA: hypothetical protein VJU18_19510 [Vicinamibacteria bacterium]|nr:hypothetical protein [Vicinamibacteria bacterium]